MKYFLYFILIMLIASIGSKINTRNAMREVTTNKSELPQLIGYHTSLDMIWVNTQTYDVFLDSDGDQGQLEAETLKQAFDYARWISGQHSIIRDEIKEYGQVLLAGNPFQDSICYVYLSLPTDSVLFTGWLYPERLTDPKDSTEHLEYTYQRAKQSTTLHLFDSRL